MKYINKSDNKVIMLNAYFKLHAMTTLYYTYIIRIFILI